MPEVSFEQDDWIIDRNNPGQPGQYTGKWRTAGPHIMIELSYPGGGTTYRPLKNLEKISKGQGDSIEDRLKAGHFGKISDLKRLITYEKLKGTLHEVIYSMEAAQIDFYPYQFKPVLKFINSPTERLIIADEVGLGKTIEAALIWIELQARRQAQRLLVVCPKILSEKWKEELRSKFILDARVVDFYDLDNEIQELQKVGPSHSFVLIATYTGLRPPRGELKLLKEPPEEGQPGTPKTQFLRELRHWALSYDPFDLVIFDEAHYMRNPETTTFHLGNALSVNAGAVLCVSATPVNNKSTDLHSLLRLIDENFFETQGTFEDLLEANRPAVLAGNALSRTPVDEKMLRQAVEGMSKSPFISKSPLFKQFFEKIETMDINDKAALARCQDIVEKLNLLGSYVNRTRRVQVKENRPLRYPVVLPVEYCDEEMRLYNAIIQLVKQRCRLDNRPFHVFQIIGLQLRAASCLPAIVEEMRNGKFGELEELIDEAMGEDIYDELFDENIEDIIHPDEFKQLIEFNFEENDSKYRELRKFLLDMVPDEKVVIFAFYRPTLSYLRYRLIKDGITVTVIHGGINNERRWEELERFKDPKGPRVLLSSEVGSEGIDLQFSRVMVNYDLPWNPMRVEQRIGRIDRVGQQAKRLSIVNFKVRHTIEERLYERLHDKLMLFANSLGDLESVIGEEIQKLTIELFSKELTIEEEKMLMDQAERVIEDRVVQIQALEESEDALIALSDYIQNKIQEDRDKGRYIQSEELEDYLSDFFAREFQGSEINYNTPAEGCMRVRLSNDAQNSLSKFISDDRSLSARVLRNRELNISFRREALQRIQLSQRRSINFTNHISPLIRWITFMNNQRAHTFYNVSALKLNYPQLPPGAYFYRIERWKMKGLISREMLSYGVMSLSDEKIYSYSESETIIQQLLRNGKDWDYVDCDNDKVLSSHRILENELAERYSLAVEDFEAENTTTYQIKEQRVRSIFDLRNAQDEKRLSTMIEAGRDERMLKMAKGRLQAGKTLKETKLSELYSKQKSDIEQAQVAAGIFLVLHKKNF